MRGSERDTARQRRFPITTPPTRPAIASPSCGVEASDLITSSDAGYEGKPQPRDRDRAASQAQIREIATRLNPEGLRYSTEADRGACTMSLTWITNRDSMITISGKVRVSGSACARPLSTFTYDVMRIV